MKRLACILLIITLLVSCTFLFRTTLASAATGVLNDNTEWTLMNSPVVLNRTLTVSNNATLTIDPGVTVNFGFYSLNVLGTLIAAGQSGNQITFTAGGSYLNSITFSYYSLNGTSPSTGSIIQNAVFNGIYIQTNQESPEIDNCAFNFGSLSESAISITGGSPTFSNNVISCSGQSYNINLISVFGGNPSIINNHFEGSYPVSNSVDIRVFSGSPQITNNVFGEYYNSASNSGVTVNSGATPQITNNQFNGNSYLTAIFALQSSSVTVSNNVFTNCVVGIQSQAGSVVTVQGNSFLRGTDGIEIAAGATFTITNNLIDSNSRYGIDGGGAISSNTITNNKAGIHNPTSCSINNNNIVGNTVNSITAAADNVDATNNWWGITDTQTINQTIYDSKIDTELGTVTFVPFLSSPSSSAPAIPNLTPVSTLMPTATPPPAPLYTLPPATPDQYSQTFVYQVGTIINLNMITGATVIAIILVWIIVILGYVAKNSLLKRKEE